MTIVPLSPEGLRKAAAALRTGEVVAYPTETVYGLAVDPFSESALRRLFAMKGRDARNPVLLVVADVTQLGPVVRTVSPRAAAYIEAFWPGPLSLLFPRADRLPALLTAGSAQVCVRCPACAPARELCRIFGGALTSSSANLSDAPPARSVAELDLPGIAVAVDGGILAPGLPSTVFDPDQGRIVREGRISMGMLERVVIAPHGRPGRQTEG